VGLVGSLLVVLAGVTVFSGVVVCGFSVGIGCVVGIGVFVVVRRVVSCITPARMLAFSALRSMRCGDGVMVRGGVALVGAGEGVVVVVGGIVVVIGVIGIVVREAVSRSKPARMLAFSSSRSMRCVDGVMVRVGGVRGVSLV